MGRSANGVKGDCYNPREGAGGGCPMPPLCGMDRGPPFNPPLPRQRGNMRLPVAASEAEGGSERQQGIRSAGARSHEPVGVATRYRSGGADASSHLAKKGGSRTQ
jgi:hypothetical protein